MQCFRVYTEDVNREGILKEARKWFANGFTCLTGTGCWADLQEACLIIEVIREKKALPTVQHFAANVKRLNKQDAVFLTVTDLSFSEIV